MSNNETTPPPARFPHPYPQADVDREMDNIKSQHRPGMKLNEWTKRDYANDNHTWIQQSEYLENLDALHNGFKHPQAISDVSKSLTSLEQYKQQMNDNNNSTQKWNNDHVPTPESILSIPNNPAYLQCITSVDRVEYKNLSPEEFRIKYEFPSQPVMIMNSIDNWPSNNWDLETLSKTQYGKAKFRIGDDDDGRAMRVELDKYLQYLDTTKDDSPLYLFEDDFGEREASTMMLKDYSPPKYFSEDLFLLTPPERRPPFRWIIAGSKRCGTKIHIDPLGSSAWNGLCSGCKRWVLFSPSTPLSIANGSFLYTPQEKALGRPMEAVEYFNIIVPRLRQWIAGLPKSQQEQYGMMEFLQYPGEVIFVPNSWPHAVVNHGNDAVAFTQNWASSNISNFKEIWKMMCARRRYLARRLFDRMQVFLPKLAQDIEELMKKDPLNIDQTYEPQNDPKMRPRKFTKYSIEERIRNQASAMQQIKSIFPDYFIQREGETDLEAQQRYNLGLEVMLQGNDDSSETDTDEEDDSSDDDDEEDETSEDYE